MKYLQNTLLLLIGALIICSCSKEDFDDPTFNDSSYNKIESGSMEAVLNGNTFTSNNIQTTRQTANLIKITASGLTEGLTITLSARSEGMYTIGGDEPNYLTYTRVVYKQSGSVETNFTSKQEHSAFGTIEVLKTDLENNTISGIFNGTLVLDEDSDMSIEIKNGIFNQVPF